MDEPASEGPRRPGLISASVGRTLARASSSALLALTVIGLARITPTHDFGVFIVAGSVATIAGLVLTMGASARILQAEAEPDFPDRSRSLYQLQAVVCVVALLGTGVVVTLLGSPVAVLAGAAWGFGDVAQNYAQCHFSGRKAHRTTNRLIVAQRLLPALVVGYYLLADTDVDFGVLTAAYLLVVLVAVAAPWPGVRHAHFDLALATGGAGGWWGLSLAPTLVLLQGPVVALTADATTAGLYGLAARVVGPVLLIPTAIATVTVPDLAVLRNTPEIWVRHRRFARFCLLYAVLVVVAAWPGALVVTALADLSSRDTHLLVAGTIVGASLSAYSQSSAALFAAFGRPAWATAGIAAGGATGLVLLAVLGAQGQVASLGLAVVATEVVVLTIFGAGVRRLRAERTTAVAPG